MNFVERLDRLAEVRSPFCLGIDPSREALLLAGLQDTVAGLKDFCSVLLDAASGSVALVKPQMAFFERFGPEGLIVLQCLVRQARDQGALVILDAKRGDIGSTNAGYGEAYFGPRSPFAADALTVTAYLGFDTLAPLLQGARLNGCAVIVVVLSSNPEGRRIQTALTSDGATVAEALADDIAAHNSAHGPVAGAVIGATMGASAGSILSRLADAPILTPGLGAQGATYAMLEQHFGCARRNIIPSASRAVLSHGFEARTIGRALRLEIEHARRFREADR